MKNRLLEELIEMSGTCSSGFASRLVNVISGFGDFNITISWKDQIIANFSGRLNARINNIHNLKMDEKQLKQILLIVAIVQLELHNKTVNKIYKFITIHYGILNQKVNVVF
jgi:hypothetical protein